MQTNREHYVGQVAAEVRAAMAREQVPRATIAAALGVYRGTLRRRLSGADEFGIGELQVVAETLGVDLYDLIPPVTARNAAA